MHLSLVCYGGASVCVVCGARLLLQGCVVGLFYGSPLTHLGTFLLFRCKCPCCLWRPSSVACWFVLWVSFHEVKFLFLLWRCNCWYCVWRPSAVACLHVCMFVCFCESLFMQSGSFLLWLCKCSFCAWRPSFVACWFGFVRLFSCS